jgi:hypothetical protein
MKNIIKNIFITLAVITGAYGLCYLITGIPHYTYAEDKSNTLPIYSLKIESQEQGSFILGIGSISGVDYYIFYKKVGGGFIREKLPCDKCVIYEGWAIPKVTEYGRMCYHHVNRKIADSSFIFDGCSRYLHELYLPTGTITKRITDINL